jgi:phage terminase large subunit-like protein
MLLPGEGGKVAPAYSVQPILSEELVYAPNRDWADFMIAAGIAFPQGGVMTSWTA